METKIIDFNKILEDRSRKNFEERLEKCNDIIINETRERISFIHDKCPTLTIEELKVIASREIADFTSKTFAENFTDDELDENIGIMMTTITNSLNKLLRGSI